MCHNSNVIHRNRGGVEREVHRLVRHWFAVFPMRIQDECLTRFRKILRQEWAGFRVGTGSYRVIRSLHVIGPVFQPEQASRGNPSQVGINDEKKISVWCVVCVALGFDLKKSNFRFQRKSVIYHKIVDFRWFWPCVIRLQILRFRAHKMFRNF
jgi:hypothetical protein